MDDFDVEPDKIGESAQRVMNRAVEESRRREHATVANEHLFCALTQVEWDTFSHVMQDLEVNPHVILDARRAPPELRWRSNPSTRSPRRSPLAAI